MARTLRFRWKAVVGLLAIGCSIELTDPLSGPSVMSVAVFVTDSVGNGHITVDGLLTMGPSTWDDPHALTDSVVLVADVPVGPVPNDLGTELHYRREWTTGGQPAPSGTVPMRLPRPVETPSTFGTLTVAVPVSVGSGEIGIAAGEDLVLTTSVERSLATPQPVLVSWRLDAREGAHRLLTLNGPGFPPSTMTIPADWLGSFSQPLNLELVTQQVLQGKDTDSEYRFGVTVWTHLHWTVTQSQTAP